MGIPDKAEDSVGGSSEHETVPTSSGELHDLPGIHDPVGIETLLDAHHDVEGVRAELEEEALALAHADAVLAGAGALHLEGADDHVLDAALDLFALAGDVRVVHDRAVEVAVADVAEDAGEEAEVIQLFLADLDDVCEATERHGDVCRPHLFSLPSQSQRRPQALLSRGPQEMSLPFRGRESEIPALVCLRDLLYLTDVFCRTHE